MSSIIPTVFDPKAVTLTLGGQTVTGFAEGTKITLTRDNQFTTTQEGVDGDIVINLNNKTVGTLTFTLFQTATFNSTMEWWAQTYMSKTGPFYVPVELNDPSSGAMSSLAWLEMQGDFSIAEEDSSLTWTLKVADATLKGNANAARISAAAGLQGFRG